jgi:hypothetical protein
MKAVSEAAFKACLARILGDSVSKDWGGETSDHFTAHLHLCGRRVKGAFLLKGHNQILRLCQEPADVYFVQHCHDITPDVHATLRAFAVQPALARRYCLINGRDSLRLLQAYKLYDEAVRLSRSPNSPP